MDNYPPDQIKVLSMNINCCEKCPEILKKKLLKMLGVNSVAIDIERNLVLVTGTIDAMTLLNNVAKLGKRVILLPSDRKHHKNKGIHHGEERPKDTRNEASKQEEKGEMHKNCCCQDRHHHKKEKEKEQEHKCEAYVPPKPMCRDDYCKVHPKMHKIVDRVQAQSSNLFGGPPFCSSFGVDPYGGSYSRPRWCGAEPPRIRHYQQSTMLPHPFDFQ